MSKQPPFEEMDERWSDLPLPDADAAWRDMEGLLDRAEKKRRIPPILPAFFSGCAGWSFLLLVAIAGSVGVYYYQHGSVPHSAPPNDLPTLARESSTPTSSPQNQSEPAPRPAPGSKPQADPGTVAAHPDSRNTTPSAPGVPNDAARSVPGTGSNSTAAPKPDAHTARNGASPLPHTTAGTPGSTRTSTVDAGNGNSPHAPATGRTSPGKPARIAGDATPVPAPIASAPASARQKARPAGTAHTHSKSKTAVQPAGIPAGKSGSRHTAPGNPVANGDKGVAGTVNGANTPLNTKPGTAASDSSVQVPVADLDKQKGLPGSTLLTAPQQSDSASKARMDAAQKASDSAAAVAAITAPKKSARRAWNFSAGVGISQALPIGGQRASAENYSNKVNPLTEHVPSGWLRAHKGRWYIQGEARFNAPQLLPGFAYTQKTRYDTAAHAVQTDRQQLRKAWYHQFPLTVNYHVLPRWTIGAGAQWSVLYRASGTRNSLRRSISSTQWQESSVPFQVPGFRDSFLYKTQWQLVLQTEYEWRRWGLGLRYRTDLQPFMRYTKPDGAVTDVRNEAFEATLRFRLWQSKRRR